MKSSMNERDGGEVQADGKDRLGQDHNHYIVKHFCWLERPATYKKQPAAQWGSHYTTDRC